MTILHTRDTLWGGSLSFWQPARGRGYRFNLDPVLLSGFVAPARHTLDLGSGCGVLGILLLCSRRTERVTAVEIQPELAELAEKNARDNGVADAFTVVCGDLRTADLPTVDSVAFNPPYYAAGGGRGAANPGRDAARHERFGTLGDFVACAVGHLLPGGTASVITPVERAGEVQSLFARCGAPVTRARPIRPRDGEPVGFTLTAAQRPHGDTAVQSCQHDPPLVVHAGTGRDYSDEVRRLLREE